jgi:crotonobetainyl-CoA:carnitine CoA-transferase CaiB-like acyl-CoA transferase
VQALGEPAWATDPRLGTAAGRLRHHDEIDEQLAAWTATLPSAEVERRLQAAGVPAERMRRADAIVGAADAGRVFAPLPTLGGQETVVARLPFRFSASGTSEPGPIAGLGEQTREALRRWLGLADTEIESLEAEGALA